MSSYGYSPEPLVEAPREPEILIIVLDCGPSLKREDGDFNKLRDIAMRMARTRLLYSVSDYDCLGVFKIGSNVTNNQLAKDNPDGYLGVENVCHAIRPSIDALLHIKSMAADGNPVNLLDALEALGDYLSDLQTSKAKKRRVVFFTDGKSICDSLAERERDDLTATCDLYRKEGIKFDVVSTELATNDDNSEDDDDTEGLGNDPPQKPCAQFFQEAYRKNKPLLWAVAHATGGTMFGSEEASHLVENPVPKRKRATAKFRGTLDITDKVQIPVKLFSHVLEARAETAAKLSWETSKQRQEPVPVHVETQRVSSTTDDSPLEPSQILSAYEYGTSLVPTGMEVESKPWSVTLPCGLSVIAFVDQKEVPERFFMGPVNALIAMPGVQEAKAALSALVQALHDTKRGILARFVASRRGGAPIMTYLWPSVETSRDSGAVKNRFLFMVELPLQEDIREYPFPSLKDAADELPAHAQRLMDQFIDDRQLDADETLGEPLSHVSDEDERDPFEPTDYCNPALDHFYICVIQRALDGPDGTELAPLTSWQRELLDPSTFVKAGVTKQAQKSLRDLKTFFPTAKTHSEYKNGRRIITTVAKNKTKGNRKDGGKENSSDDDVALEEQAEKLLRGT